MAKLSEYAYNAASNAPGRQRVWEATYAAAIAAQYRHHRNNDDREHAMAQVYAYEAMLVADLAVDQLQAEMKAQ